MMSSNNVYRAFKNVTTYQEVKKNMNLYKTSVDEW